jgi:hypothetical protein
MNLFDYAEAERRKEEGIERVSTGTSADWVRDAIETIRTKFHIGETLTSERLRAAVGKKPHHHNAVGAALNHAARAGLIQKTGLWIKSQRPEAHGRELRQWVRIPPPQN